jgi:hypothetical protein
MAQSSAVEMKYAASCCKTGIGRTGEGAKCVIAFCEDVLWNVSAGDTIFRNVKFKENKQH